MELGESFEETAIRELEEETGLTAISMKLIRVISGKKTFRTYPNGDQLYDITAIFEITEFKGSLSSDNEETKKLEYFSIDNLPTLTSMTETIIEEYKDYLNKN